MKKFKLLEVKRKVNGKWLLVDRNTKLIDIFPVKDWENLYNKHYKFPTKPLTPIQDMVYDIFPSFRTLECIYESLYAPFPVFNDMSTLGDFIAAAFSDNEFNIRRFGIHRKIYIRSKVKSFIKKVKTNKTS